MQAVHVPGFGKEKVINYLHDLDRLDKLSILKIFSNLALGSDDQTNTPSEEQMKGTKALPGRMPFLSLFCGGWGGIHLTLDLLTLKLLLSLEERRELCPWWFFSPQQAVSELLKGQYNVYISTFYLGFIKRDFCHCTLSNCLSILGPPSLTASRDIFVQTAVNVYWLLKMSSKDSFQLTVLGEKKPNPTNQKPELWLRAS